MAQQLDLNAVVKGQTDMMTIELKLTPDQVQKVNAINSNYTEKMMTQMADGGDRDAMLKAMASINAEKRQELVSILTADQVERYDAYMAANPFGFIAPPNRGGNRGGEVDTNAFEPLYGNISPTCGCEELAEIKLPNTTIESAVVDTRTGACMVTAMGDMMEEVGLLGLIQ